MNVNFALYKDSIYRAALYLLQSRHRRQANSSSAPTQATISSIRRYLAVAKGIPMPVAAERYSARHTGHLGTSSSSTPGNTPPAVFLQQVAAFIMKHLL